HEEAQDALNSLLEEYPSPEIQMLIYGVRACCYAQYEEYRKEALQDIGAVFFLSQDLSQRALEHQGHLWISDIVPILHNVTNLPIFFNQDEYRTELALNLENLNQQYY